MTDFGSVLEALSNGGVRYVLIGGLAAAARGSTRSTIDVDVVYDRAPDNLSALAAALAPYRPYLRDAPPGLPFVWDATTLRHGFNFTLTTTLGDLDLLAEVPPSLDFAALVLQSTPVALMGQTVRIASVDALVTMKRAAGRPKDLDALAELMAIQARSR